MRFKTLLLAAALVGFIAWSSWRWVEAPALRRPAAAAVPVAP